MTKTSSLIATAAVSVAAAMVPTAGRGDPPVTTRPLPHHHRLGQYDTFVLTPVPPPVPALAVRLLTGPDRAVADNAALYFERAGVLFTAEDQDLCGKASLAYAPPDADRYADWPAFDAAMGPLLAKGEDVFESLDRAARCDHCDWARPWPDDGGRPRGFGVENRLVQTFAFMNEARITYALRAGRTADAIAGLRTGYEMARKTADAPGAWGGAWSALVFTNEQAAKLMTVPDAPNLYWPLVGLLPAMPTLADEVRRDRAAADDVIPLERKAGRSAIVPADWPVFARQARAYAASYSPDLKLAPVATDAEVAGVLFRVLPAATRYYARTRHLAPADVAKLDPALVAATYGIEGVSAAWDQWEAIGSLPPWQALPRAERFHDWLTTNGLDAAARLVWAYSGSPSMVVYARVSRPLPALAAVEAIGSYAATHDGRLPDRLADVTDTPVPNDPVTGQPFEYRLESGTATLGSYTPLTQEQDLEFTVRIRRP